jgi:hypothetical protein
VTGQSFIESGEMLADALGQVVYHAYYQGDYPAAAGDLASLFAGLAYSSASSITGALAWGEGTWLGQQTGLLDGAGYLHAGVESIGQSIRSLNPEQFDRGIGSAFFVDTVGAVVTLPKLLGSAAGRFGRYVDDVTGSELFAAPGKGLTGTGARGVRNTIALTVEQHGEVLQAARSIGISPDDIRFFSGTQGSNYSDMMDKILVGPNIFPQGGNPVLGTRSVFDRLSVRTALAHEGGHMMAARGGIDFPGGTVMQEFQANVLAARHTPGLTSLERYQLLRNAIEEARFQGVDWRTLRPQLRHFPGGN